MMHAYMQELNAVVLTALIFVPTTKSKGWSSNCFTVALAYQSHGETYAWLLPHGTSSVKVVCDVICTFLK